ncbi:lytic transglycosylase domain-containing protein [Phytohabitans kaempferiae]|uniref:Lytic transglycosylase domain-containing protein n=1 Tax=Phytohabitans kaempferiae TaxID=1620943 RepID=A0ABV6M135_9ACTN
MVRGVKLRAGVVGIVTVFALSGCLEQAPVGAAEPGPVATTAAAAEETPEVRALAQEWGAAPTPSATPTPKESATTRPPSKPKPKRKPPVETKLPPAPPQPPPAGCKPTYEGTAASRAEVKQALTAAAGRTYWPTSAPSIKVPVNLVKATAWQESGWQSHIVACDGGIGLMQVMPDTAAFVNQRFGQSYDVRTYTDNATLGANYLAWLIKYFGDVYFERDYTLVSSGDCASHTAPCLINAVIAAYNYGFGAVDTDAGLVIPNPRYVENVRALMTNCECLSF